MSEWFDFQITGRIQADNAEDADRKVQQLYLTIAEAMSWTTTPTNPGFLADRYTEANPGVFKTADPDDESPGHTWRPEPERTDG